MPTTPGGIWTPGDNDDWDLTVDLAAMAVSIDGSVQSAVDAVDAVQAALDAMPFVQTGTTSFNGASGSGAITISVTFDTPYASAPKVVMGSNNTINGVVLSATPTSISTTGFTARMVSTSPTSGPGFGGVYSVDWIAVGTKA